MKTYSQKGSEVKRNWILVDASELPLGRLATFVATRLLGKNKPTYTPHVDGGDFVVVINAEKLVVTGNKAEDKMYYSYSGFPSGLKEINLRDKLAKDAASVIEAAVKGMLPKNKLQPGRLERLRIFNGEKHDHEAQKPVKVDLAKSRKPKAAKKETK